MQNTNLHIKHLETNPTYYELCYIFYGSNFFDLFRSDLSFIANQALSALKILSSFI